MSCWFLQWFPFWFIRVSTTTAICFWPLRRFRAGVINVGRIVAISFLVFAAVSRATYSERGLLLQYFLWSLQWFACVFNSLVTTTAICFWSLQWFACLFNSPATTTAICFWSLQWLHASFTSPVTITAICFWSLQRFHSFCFRRRSVERLSKEGRLRGYSPGLSKVFIYYQDTPVIPPLRVPNDACRGYMSCSSFALLPRQLFSEEFKCLPGLYVVFIFSFRTPVVILREFKSACRGCTTSLSFHFTPRQLFSEEFKCLPGLNRDVYFLLCHPGNHIKQAQRSA